MSRWNILVGGPTERWPEILKNDPKAIPGNWIGVDRGSFRLLKMGIIPKIAIGDYDSLIASERDWLEQNVKDIRYSIPEKDDTDTELGLKVALFDVNASEIVIYGTTGGRIDHELVNLFMLLEPRFRPFAERVTLIDKQNTIRFYLPGHHTIQKEPDKKYLAFVSLTKVDNLTLFDEKYQLDHFSSDDPISWASNEFIGDHATFSFQSGLVAVIQSKD